jgi:hypothetical protein
MLIQQNQQLNTRIELIERDITSLKNNLIKNPIHSSADERMGFVVCVFYRHNKILLIIICCF